ALPSLSASTTNESVFVAEIVGTNGATFGAIDRWEATDAGAEVAVFTGSGLLLLLVLGVPGCDFHNHPALLDTETEKAATATRATTAINNVAGLFLLILGYLRYLRVLRI